MAEMTTEIMDWAKGQKRITNRMLRERFDITEEEAAAVYNELRLKHIIIAMGYVNKEVE